MSSANVLRDYVIINSFKRNDIGDIYTKSDNFFCDIIGLSIICSKRNVDFGKCIVDLFNQYTNLYEKNSKSISKEMLYYCIDDITRDKSCWEYYKDYMKLLTKTRSGHNYWNVNGYRECVSEHIFATVCLANIINHYYDLDIDINRISAMLALHETEEVIMGDLTDFDCDINHKISYGKKCRNDMFDKLSNSDYFKELIDEFDNRETKEAKFAYLCDKLEYLLQVKVYEERGMYNFNDIPKNVVTNSESVINIINNGASSVFDVHYEYDKNKFSDNDIFYGILEDAKNNKILCQK